MDDGEAGEATIFLARAKVYHLDKESGAWKERGAGILKVNVPEATIDFDQSGAALTASFDASMLDAGDSDSKTPKVVRLIMRQDHTLRVVINTAVLAGTEFVRREMMKAVGFLFTALEGPDARPVTLQVKVCAVFSSVNAKQALAHIFYFRCLRRTPRYFNKPSTLFKKNSSLRARPRVSQFANANFTVTYLSLTTDSRP